MTYVYVFVIIRAKKYLIKISLPNRLDYVYTEPDELLDRFRIRPVYRVNGTLVTVFRKRERERERVAFISKIF